MTWFSGLLSALAGILFWPAMLVLGGLVLFGGLILWGVRDWKKRKNAR